MLSKKATGESHLRYQIFSVDHGLLLCLKRISSKKTPKVLPDLFDRAELDLEKPQSGSAWFLNDYRVIKRHNGIARNYKTLLCASEFASALLKNLVHAETFEGLYRLTEVAMQSWEEGLNPTVVLFKSFYLFAREEGYPVKEDWWRNLPPASREQAALILNKKTENLKIREEALECLLEDLKRWLTHSTDILL